MEGGWLIAVSTAAMVLGGLAQIGIIAYRFPGVNRKHPRSPASVGTMRRNAHLRSNRPGRGERIRTSGLYVPNVALYQAKLHPAVAQLIRNASPAIGRPAASRH